MQDLHVAVVLVAKAPQLAGQTLLVLEAMKMEHRITAPTDGTVDGCRWTAVGGRGRRRRP